MRRDIHIDLCTDTAEKPGHDWKLAKGVSFGSVYRHTWPLVSVTKTPLQQLVEDVFPEEVEARRQREAEKQHQLISKFLRTCRRLR